MTGRGAGRIAAGVVLGIPVLGGLMPAVALLALRAMWFGLPAAVLWIFGWLPLTALCLSIAGRLCGDGAEVRAS